MSLQTILIFSLVAILVGLSKGGLGGPVPVSLTTPLLSLIIPVSQSVGIILPALLLGDAFALYFYWRKWDAAYVRRLLPAAVIGIVIGTFLLNTLSNDMLRKVIGIFTLIAVIYKVATDQLKSVQYSPRDWHGYLAGWAGGFGSSLANAGGPPVTAYLLLQPDMTPLSFVGTSSLFFAVVNLLKLPGFLSTGVLDVQLLLGILWIAPLVPLGVWVGRYIVLRMDRLFFERLMLGLLLIMGLLLLFT